MASIAVRRRRRESQPVSALPAGTLLPISRLGADGTIVLDDGSFAHVIACYPRNLQTLTADERVATFLNFRNIAAFQERGQSLQLIVEGDRVKTATHMAFVDEQIEKVYGFRPERGQRRGRAPAHPGAALALGPVPDAA